MLLTLAVALSSASTSAFSIGSTVGADDEVVHELLVDLPDRWQGAMSEMSIPGMSVVVVMDDQVALLKCFGERDVVNAKPVTSDTAFYIASATKPFVAFALAALADEGKVDLDAPVKQYLPRFELADPNATEEITVRDILCHSPGINYGPIVLLDAYTGEITEDRYYHFLARATPRGTTDYSNVHFTIAGRIVEAITGRHWRDELAVRIFEPLGMKSTTGYADEMYARDDVAFPTVWEGGEHRYAAVRKTDRTMHAAGGLGTSANDVAQWLRVNLNGGRVGKTRLLSSERTAEMQKQHSEGGVGGGAYFADRGFGLGWQFGSFQELVSLQHGGGYVGSSSLITFLPEAGIGVGVLINTDVGGAQLCELITADVMNRLLVGDAPDLLPEIVARVNRTLDSRSAEPAPENPVDGGLSLPPQAYVGAFVNEHLGTFRIGLTGGAMTAHLGQMGMGVGKGGAPDEVQFVGNFGSPGTFEIEGGKVIGLEIDLGGSGEEYRFERQ